MEKLDLTKILKNCPKGWKFWSPIFGEVEFEKIVESISVVNLKYVNVKKNNNIWSFYSDATFPIDNIKSDEILLYPSKYQRDWSKFVIPWCKKERFDLKTLKPFDKVLVKCTSIYNSNLVWRVGLFSYFHVEDDSIRVYTLGSDDNTPNLYVIPYNDNTKHLVNTTEDAPEYYRYWED